MLPVHAMAAGSARVASCSDGPTDLCDEKVWCYVRPRKVGAFLVLKCFRRSISDLLDQDGS